MRKLLTTIISALAIVLILDSVAGEAKIGTQGKNISLDTWISPREISSKFPYYISGFDNENRPIFVIEMGKWDLRTTIEAGGKDLEDLELHILQLFYRMEQAGKYFRNGEEQGAEDVAIITDWEDYSLLQLASSPTVQFFLKHMAGFQRIQEQISYGFFVNANSVASTLINLARPIMGSVMERIEVHGTQKSRWIPRLLRKFRTSQIPPWYGGQEKFSPIAIYG
ncbi:unnamed protein product [Allacma fusca]|uniref:CRAL-TRIO domain-containing protein n=1 Tax=Allacma fusca TaxID=39272 RepID=A0A8J2JFD5_9HEXA|nr:unnamed protein product [Allacma fusca]